MTDLNIRYGLSSDIFIDGQINPKLIIEAGCWYLCTDTAELFLGIDTGTELTLKRINDPSIPVDNLVFKDDLTEVKQEVIQTVKPDVEEVKNKVEAVLPKVENELVPTVNEVKIKVEEEILPKVETVDALKEWVENKEYLQDIDLDGYATEEYVNNKFTTIDLTDYYNKSEVDALIPVVPTKVSELENDSKYITLEDVPETDLSNYYNKSETETLVNEAVNGIDMPDTSNFITMEDVEGKGYLTEHQSLDEYAKKSELFSKSYNDLTDAPVIPSINGLATEAYVDDAIANLDIPKVVLSDYALKSELVVKADDIPFTANRYVSNAIGNFVIGESVKGLTIAEILAKLLGLSNVPQGVVDDIIVNKHGLYQFNDSIEIEKIEFELTEFGTTEEYTSAPEETTFYQYTYTNDDGQQVTESGYQHYTKAQDFIYYMIMLPSSLVIGENVKVQAWSPSRNMWMDTTTVLEGDPEVIAANFADVDLEMPTIPEGYTMWVDFSDVNPGNKVRYIIIE